MKRRRRRRNYGFVDDCCVLSRKKIVREGNFMEEMAPAVALPLGMGNPVCENPMEIARLKLMAETAASILMPDPMAGDLVVRNNSSQSCEGEDGDDVEVRMMPGSVDDAVSVALDSETGMPSSTADFAMGVSSSSVELIGGSVLDVSPKIMVPEVRGRKRSVYLLDYFPLWGCISICGRRPEMEDAVVVVPRFFEIPPPDGGW